MGASDKSEAAKAADAKVAEAMALNKKMEELWADYNAELHRLAERPTIELDLLLPNGLVVPMKCPTSRTLASLKQDVFMQAKRLPLSKLLKDPRNYVFYAIGTDGNRVELYDEQKTIRQLRLFLPMLVLHEPEGSTIEGELNQNISAAMGTPLLDLQENLTAEMKLFRFHLFEVCELAVRDRGTSGFQHYAFPEATVLPQLMKRDHKSKESREVSEDDLDIVCCPENHDELEARAMQRLVRKIQSSDAYAEIWYRRQEDDDFCVSVRIREVMEKTPSDIIKLAINAFAYQNVEVPEKPEDFVLQVAGKRVFLTRDMHITRFEYIRSCFENYRIPKLIMRRKNIVFLDYPTPTKLFEPSYVRAERSQQNGCLRQEDDHGASRSFWDLDDNLRIRIHAASHITVHDVERIFIRSAVTVGRHVIDVQDSPLVNPGNPRWPHCYIEYNAYMKDLPESTQISFTLLSVRQKKNKQEEEPLGWVNMRLFNWKGQLIQGKHTLFLWPFPKDFADTINTSGAPGQSNIMSATRIEIEFPDYDCPVQFPDKKTILKFVEILRQREARSSKQPEKIRPVADGSQELARIMHLRTKLDAMKLSQDDQQFLWKYRHKIQKLFPQMLVVLADLPLIWRERETFCEFYALLDEWPELQVDTAVELLDSRYTDSWVRRVAVENLNKQLDNDQLTLYVLPLVQALRYEPYSFSALTDMLMRRSLLNYRIGHTLFWLLRAELAHFTFDLQSQKMPEIFVRYALLLEAYCRGNAVHLRNIVKQVELVNTLTSLSVLVKTVSAKESATKKLQQELHSLKETMQNMHSPLNATDRLGELMIEECRVLGSAKQPLKMCWKNPEPLARLSVTTHEILFKNGDDLRQDMLTLQVMRIMDAKWKNQNLDYCMTLYEVLPMGRNIGMIHVVQNCQTIFQIQCSAKQIGSSVNMDVSLLNKYIYQKCSSDSKQYMECVDRFAFSLAGYCVATYVLGIKDRHQDNIMIAKDGRIFHIDFGHFLGHTKRKLGINRERTDFILTDHFLYVISRGKSNFRETYEYNNFRESCLKGFMVIYHHSRFFIALFRMMLCMGLPELSKQEDVNFLHGSLMYDKHRREEAKAAFLQTFDGVVKSDWSVSLNWFFHSVRHL